MWMRREVKCCNVKVICAAEELLNGLFWSFSRDRNSQLLAGRNKHAPTNTETKGDEWVSTGYQLPSDTSCLCLCCVIYTQASARTAPPSSSRRITAMRIDGLLKNVFKHQRQATTSHCRCGIWHHVWTESKRNYKSVSHLDVDISNFIAPLKKKPQTHRLYIFLALENTLRLFAWIKC